MSSQGNVQHLDTEKFANTISTLKKSIAEYNDIKNEIKVTTDTLFEDWTGEGKTQFQKDYATLFRQLTDIADIMYELYDTLVEAEATYIKADEEAAKLLTIK